MLPELAVGELTDLVVSAAGRVINKTNSVHSWKQLFVNCGKFFCEYEKNADQIFDDLSVALSSQNMAKLAAELDSENGYEIKDKLFNYILSLLHQYEVPEDVALSYASGITNEIINGISVIAPEKYDRYFLNDWREEDKSYLQSLSLKIEKINTALTTFNERKINVYSANDFDIELKRKTINPKIGIDFFEIDDDRFKTAFSEKIHDNKICVRGRFVEETIYCILNELWRIREPRAVFVVQSEEDWGHLRSIEQEGNIYIPNFVADEIVPIDNNTNIFIYTDDIPAFSNEIIELRPRTYETISKCLIRAGMEINKANVLVAETHGLYVAMKKKLFNGQLLKIPLWISGLDNKIKKTCLLLGQWTECEGDIAVVENLSGMKYAEFVDKLMPYTKGEDPFIHVMSRRGTKSYYLSSVENTWEYFQVSISDEIWGTFVELFLDVLNEHEKIFTYGQGELILAQFSGERLFWSSVIRKGMLKTLLIKAGYKQHEECQEYLDEIVERILSFIDNSEKWKYISEFFVEICEIAPEVTLKRLFAELDTSTGLMDLFENQNSDFIMGKNHYIKILFGIEEFLLQKEFATDAYIWLLKLDDKNFEFKSNSPANEFAKILCPWHNFSVFRSAVEKIKLAELAFKYSKNAWQIIYKNLPKSHQNILGTLNAPKYRECVQDDDTTNEEFHSSVSGYLHLLLKHTEFKPERWIDLIKYSDEVDESIRNKIIESFLCESAQMMDSEIIQVKDSIRKLIYRHRYFASASWAMPEKEIMVYEQLLNEIHATNPEYEFLYLFKPKNGSPLLHPVPYDVENKQISNEDSVKRLLEVKIAEFKEKRYDLSLLAELCSAVENSSLGHALAKYWDGVKFDTQVFITLLKAQKSGSMAIDYYSGFASQTFELFHTVMEIALKNKVEIGIITAIYRVEAWFSKELPRIAEAEDSVKREFWKHEVIQVNYDTAWCVEECKLYGTLNSYISILYFMYHNNDISIEKLYYYLDGIEKMEINQSGGDFQYYLEELLKPLQDTYMNDSSKCARIAKIEMIFFHYLDWNNMKCLKKSINQDPQILADLISIVFKKDHGVWRELSEKEENRISNFYNLYYKMEFCPTETNGEIKRDELDVWIKQFNEYLKENDQMTLFGMVTGRLFAFSPVGQDKHMPCEAVREMIEIYSDQNMQQEYRATIYNRRGVHSPSAGKEEQKIAERFQNNAEYLSLNGYPKTAKIYYDLARSFFHKSAVEREDAENGRF